MNFIEKIEDLQKQICCLKNSSGDPNVDVIDNGDGTFTFTNGVDAPVTFDVKKTVVVDNGDGTFTLTDDFGNTVIIDTVVKTQCEIDSDVDGIKLADTFYENLDTSHLVKLSKVQVFDPAGDLIQANVVKDDCGLKVFVNPPEVLFKKEHSVSDLSTITDLSVGGKPADVVSIVVTNLTSDYNVSTWYAATVTAGKKKNQKIVIANYSGTPFNIAFNHANIGPLKLIANEEILTVSSREDNILYED
jgi:hypothetical protein